MDKIPRTSSWREFPRLTRFKEKNIHRVEKYSQSRKAHEVRYYSLWGICWFGMGLGLRIKQNKKCSSVFGKLRCSCVRIAVLGKHKLEFRVGQGGGVLLIISHFHFRILKKIYFGKGGPEIDQQTDKSTIQLQRSSIPITD